jgi:hypothetical protein
LIADLANHPKMRAGVGDLEFFADGLPAVFAVEIDGGGAGVGSENPELF